MFGFGDGSNFASVVPQSWLVERLSREFIVVICSEHNTSALCSCCGSKVKPVAFGRTHRFWKCPGCQFQQLSPSEQVKNGQRIIQKDVMAAISISAKLIGGLMGLKDSMHSPIFGAGMENARCKVLERARRVETETSENEKESSNGRRNASMSPKLSLGVIRKLYRGASDLRELKLCVTLFF